MPNNTTTLRLLTTVINNELYHTTINNSNSNNLPLFSSFDGNVVKFILIIDGAKYLNFVDDGFSKHWLKTTGNTEYV